VCSGRRGQGAEVHLTITTTSPSAYWRDDIIATRPPLLSLRSRRPKPSILSHKSSVKAQREGKYKGRVPTVCRRSAEIIRLKEAGVTPTEIASRLGIGRASVYRILGSSGGEDRREAA
jgi:Helix-turn-helix domain of resolvase